MTHTIVAELVGNVLTVLVREGDQVEEGATIVILESMKMEIPVLSEYPGVVQDVSVHEGDVVQEGDTLAVIATRGSSPGAS
jgi:biotin carboxyl carrier protein